jgi:hypothetical protein
MTTHRTYRQIHNSMEVGTTAGIATSLYSYIQRHTEELVHGIGTAQRNYKWEHLQQNFVIVFALEHENPMMVATLKLIKERIFEGPEVEIVTTY